MESLFIYLLKVNALLLLFWVFYAIFFKNESFYTLNRWYFLVSIAISFGLPNLWFTKYIVIEKTRDKNLTLYPNFTYIDAANPEQISFWESINWTQVGYQSVLIVSVFMLLFFVFKVSKLFIQIKKLPHFKSKNIKVSPENKTSFSFYKYIIISADVLKSKNISLIIEHEKIHIKQKHTLDLLLIEAICKLFWFNPLLKYLQKSMVLNLEFFVDEKVSQKFDSKTYQFSLIQAQINQQSNMVSTYNTNDIKKRIVQLNNQKSKNMKKLKFLITIPALTAFCVLFQVKTIAQENKTKEKEEYNISYTAVAVENESETEIHKNGFSIVINQGTPQSFLNKMESKLRNNYNLDFKFKNVKRDKNQEITQLNVYYNDKKDGKNLDLTYKSKNGISPFILSVKPTENNNYTVYITENEPKNTNNNVVYASWGVNQDKFKDFDKHTIFKKNPTKKEAEDLIKGYFKELGLDYNNTNLSKYFKLNFNQNDVVNFDEVNFNNLQTLIIYKQEYAKHYLNNSDKKGIIFLATNDFVDTNTTQYIISEPATKTIQFRKENDPNNVTSLTLDTSKPYMLKDKKVLYLVDGEIMEDIKSLDSDNFESVTVIKEKDKISEYIKNNKIKNVDLKSFDAIISVKLKDKWKFTYNASAVEIKDVKDVINANGNNVKYTTKAVKGKYEATATFDPNNNDIVESVLTSKAKEFGINYTKGDYKAFTNNGFVFVLNDKLVDDVSKLDLKDVNYVFVDNGKNGIKKYGNKAKNGILHFGEVKDN